MIVRSVDVARRAGVSRATVSQILNGHADRFAPETTARVLQAADELDYQPSVAARALRRGSSDIVIALIPNTTFGGNLQDLFERMTEDLSKRGFTLLLRMTNPDPSALDRLVVSLKPAAVMSMTPFTPEERELLTQREILFTDPPSSSQIDHNHAIGQLQASTLIERGHRRLAFAHLSDARQDPFGFAREEGVRAAAREAGLEDIKVVRLAVRLDSALTALDELAPPRVGVACYNDEVAAALLAAARVRGFGVPEDVALIGMDASPLSRVTLPALTTVEYDMGAAARTASVALLHTLSASGPEAAANPAALRLVAGGTV